MLWGKWRRQRSHYLPASCVVMRSLWTTGMWASRRLLNPTLVRGQRVFTNIVPQLRHCVRFFGHRSFTLRDKFFNRTVNWRMSHTIINGGRLGRKLTGCVDFLWVAISPATCLFATFYFSSTVCVSSENADLKRLNILHITPSSI